jgi:hypothetical protein
LKNIIFIAALLSASSSFAQAYDSSNDWYDIKTKIEGVRIETNFYVGGPDTRLYVTYNEADQEPSSIKAPKKLIEAWCTSCEKLSLKEAGALIGKKVLVNTNRNETHVDNIRVIK